MDQAQDRARERRLLLFLLAAALSAALLAGCERSGPPAPPDLADARQTSQAQAPSEIPAPSAYPVPGRQGSVVTLGLADAEAQTLAWSNPDGDARILRSGTVALERLAEAFPDDGSPDPGIYLFGGSIGELDAGAIPSAELHRFVDGPVHMVELAQAGMDIRSAEQDVTYPRPSPCHPVDAGSRYTQTLLFDAGPGRYLGTLMDAPQESLWAAAQQVPEGLEIRTPTPSPAATQTPRATRPTPTRDPTIVALPTLATGDSPRSLDALLEVVPVVPGARWTYRVTQVEDVVQWSRRHITETVVEARMLGPETAEIELDWDTDRPMPFDNLSPWGRMGSTLYLTPSSLLAPERHDYQDIPDLARLLRDLEETSTRPPDPNGQGSGPDPRELVRIPLREGPRNYVWRLHPDPLPLDTPAGHFEGCWILSELYSARGTWLHWLCPGVGFVRHERWGCNSSWGRAEVYELVDWQIPARP